jgi:hypothetical protein
MTPPTCHRHGHPLEVVEEGHINGALVRYWGRCPGKPAQLVDGCPRHGDSEYARRRRDGIARLNAALADDQAVTPRCLCKPAVSCDVETRTERTDHVELDLFGGGA